MRNSTIVSILIVLFIVLGGWYWWSLNGGPAMPGITPPVPDGVACTMEAKQCPDGSYVGRTGPNCAFAPCPTPSASAEINGSANQGNMGGSASGQVQQPGGTAADDPGLGDASVPPPAR